MSFPQCPSHATMDWLETPTSDMIQTQTYPPYGEPEGVYAPGDVKPISTTPAQEKGLAGGGKLQMNYAIVQNMYKAILFPWLVDQLNVAAWDTRIAQEGLPALPVSAMGLPQYSSRCVGVDLSYIYIRNNIYIERLSQDQIDLFLEYSTNPNFAEAPKLVAIVMDTYPTVIRFKDADGDFRVGYDDSGQSFHNDAVVIEVTYGAPGPLPSETTREWAIFVADTVVPEMVEDLETRWPGHTAVFWHRTIVRPT